MDTTDWVKILVAVGTLFTTVIGGLGVWWLRIMGKRTELALKEAEFMATVREKESRAAKTVRRDTLEEYSELINQYRSDKESDRKLVHELRNDNAVLTSRLGAAEERIKVCDEDRGELREQLEDIFAALDAANIRVNFRHPLNRLKKIGNGDRKQPGGEGVQSE